MTGPFQRSVKTQRCARVSGAREQLAVRAVATVTGMPVLSNVYWLRTRTLVVQSEVGGRKMLPAARVAINVCQEPVRVMWSRRRCRTTWKGGRVGDETTSRIGQTHRCARVDGAREQLAARAVATVTGMPVLSNVYWLRTLLWQCRARSEVERCR